MQSEKGGLHVYSSGAVAPPVKTAASKFSERHGMQFRFTVGKAEKLIEQIIDSKEGDILTCGAEFILDDAEEKNIILRDGRRSVGCRRSVILVPTRNPKNLNSLYDLTRDGVRIGISISGCLVGVWDDICSKAGLTDDIRKNITDFADGCGALMALVNERRVDAAFGWNAFKNLWPKTIDIIQLPTELQVYRSTGVALIEFSENRELASNFIDFLVSEEGKRVYTEYGWYHKRV